MKKLFVFMGFALFSCSSPQEGGQGPQLEGSQGCLLRITGGTQSVYVVAGFLSHLAREKTHIKKIIVTEVPTLAAVWYAQKRNPFDLEWLSDSLPLTSVTPVEPSAWAFAAKDSISQFMTNHMKVTYFSDLEVPVVISWWSRVSQKQRLSWRGTLKEPIQSALTTSLLHLDPSAGSGNEFDPLPSVEGEGEVPSIWLHVHETLISNTRNYWNSWRNLLDWEIMRASKDKKTLLIRKHIEIKDSPSRSDRNRFFREGKDLAIEKISELDSLCGKN